MNVLGGIRVLDLTTGPVGGLATMALADFGADVVKVEPATGDRFRSQPAAVFWLRGKRSVVLEPDEPGDRRALDALIDRCDILVVSSTDSKLRSMGCDWETASRRNRSIIHCNITAFGSTGRYAELPGYEGLVAAHSGRMAVFDGQALRTGPVFAALPIGSHAASQAAVQGMLAALWARDRRGGCHRVETSLLRGMLAYDLASLLIEQLRDSWPGEIPDPKKVGGGMPTLNYHPVMAADGRWIQLGNLLEHHLYAFLEATDLLPELLVEEAFQTPPASWSRSAVESARDRILARMRERKASEWMEIFRAHGGVVAETFLSSQQALQHPDLVGNGDVFEREHPRLGPVRQLGVLAQLDSTPGSAGGLPPGIGEHNEAVRAQWNAIEPHTATPAAGAASGRPLDGVTVLEVATIIAAPLATTMLADLGARVIKLEAIGGDPYRHLLPQGLLAVKTNAGKESLCVDLKTDAGREILHRLAARSDVVLHNFRPGVPERLGLGYEQLSATRPDLVWVAATGYGPNGPGARRPCAHPVAGAAMGGVVHQAGAGMPPVDCDGIEAIRDAARRLMRANEANPDPNTSVVLASAVLLGLVGRQRHGIGQQISVNMMAANAYANADDMLAYAGKPDRPTVDAGLHGLGACYRLYETADGWVFLAIGSDAQWRRFVEAAAHPTLASDPRFETIERRRANDSALADLLSAAFRERTADAWEALLVPARVGCVRVHDDPGSFLMSRPDLTAEVEHLRFGRTRRWGPLVVCNGGPDKLGPGALAGEHTDTLLEEIGYSPREIEELRAEGIVASEPV